MQDAELIEAEAGQEARTTPPKVASPSAPQVDTGPVREDGIDAEPVAATPTEAAPTLIDKLTPGPQDLPALSCGCRNHRQLRTWLQGNLYRGATSDNNQRNAATLRSLLVEITRWRAPARLRLACLETLRPKVASLCEELTDFQESGAFRAQTQDQRRAVLIASILWQHLAQAYTSVSAELARPPQPLFCRRPLARSLHRATDSYRRLIHISSLFYLATPRHTWVRLQQLLQLAREQNLAQRRVSDPLRRQQAPIPSARRESTAQAYLHTVLFASTNPLQLSATEQTELWHLCGQWARRARLRDGCTAECPSLLASLALDQAPIPAARLHHTSVDLQHFAAPQGWSVDLSGPLHQLRKRQKRPADSDPDLLARIYGLWDGNQGRGGRRTPVDVRCDLAIGISAICHHLSQTQGPAPEIAATFETESPSADRHHGKDLVMEVGSVDFYSGRTLNEYEVRLPSAPSIRREGELRGRQQENRYPRIPAVLTNTSSNGAGLQLPGELQGRLRCGDLVAITMADQWKVAIVRWHYALPDQCRAGIEFLAGHSSAIRVIRHTGDGRRTAPMAGMLTGDSGRDPELILPTPLFQPGDTVDIVAAGHARSVTLQQQTLTTGSFAIFEFS